VDVVDHAVGLSIGLAPASIEGTGAIRVRATRATNVVVLDADRLRISRVSIGGNGLGYRSADGRLCARLPRPIAVGEEVVLDVAWEVPTDGESPSVSAETVWAGYAAWSWMPTLKDAAQRATLELRISTPVGWKAKASGRAAGTTTGADGRPSYSFVVERPSPPFLFSFAAGRFEEASIQVGSVTLRALGPRGADLQLALTTTAPILELFQRQIGVPYPGSEYSEVFVHGEDVAQEAVGFALLALESIAEVRKDPTEDWIFSHELAHQWFASLVSCVDFGDFWLNEGFASFLVAFAKEKRWGRPAYEREVALFRARSRKVHADGQDAPVSLNPPGVSHRNPKETELQKRGVTYARGALVLDKLRTLVGDAVFWRGIRRYTEDRAGKSASSEDLRVALEAVSGRDLRPFFARWVYAAAPDL
jgi:aminopeptidase N